MLDLVRSGVAVDLDETDGDFDADVDRDDVVEALVVLVLVDDAVCVCELLDVEETEAVDEPDNDDECVLEPDSDGNSVKEADGDPDDEVDPDGDEVADTVLVFII